MSNQKLSLDVLGQFRMLTIKTNDIYNVNYCLDKHIQCFDVNVQWGVSGTRNRSMKIKTSKKLKMVIAFAQTHTSNHTTPLRNGILLSLVSQLEGQSTSIFWNFKLNSFLSYVCNFIRITKSRDIYVSLI